jgi:hypothetical protein
MATHQATAKIEVSSSLRADAKVIRGPQSWAYIYIALGFTVAIQLTMIPLLAEFPWNAILCIAIVALTSYLFLFNGWFQNKLLGVKNWYEGKAR